MEKRARNGKVIRGGFLALALLLFPALLIPNGTDASPERDMLYRKACLGDPAKTLEIRIGFGDGKEGIIIDLPDPYANDTTRFTLRDETGTMTTFTARYPSLEPPCIAEGEGYRRAEDNETFWFLLTSKPLNSNKVILYRIDRAVTTMTKIDDPKRAMFDHYINPKDMQRTSFLLPRAELQDGNKFFVECPGLNDAPRGDVTKKCSVTFDYRGRLNAQVGFTAEKLERVYDVIDRAKELLDRVVRR